MSKERLSVHRRDTRLTSPLLRYASNNTSQGGEDGIIKRIFDLLPHTTDDGKRKFCADIGSWDGVHLSNTHGLLMSGWHGLLLEADEERSSCAAELYRSHPGVTCVNAMVTSGSLPSILRDHGVPEELSFLSIDIDGGDYHLFNSLRGSAYRPKLVCIEFNPGIPNCISFVQEDSPQHKGSSLRAIRDLGLEMGYVAVATTTFNVFLLHRSLYCHMADLPQPLPANGMALELEDLHSEGMCTWMLQTYDGELKYAGVLKLLWQRRAINGQQLQVLKKKEWHFPFAPLSASSSSSSSNTACPGVTAAEILTTAGSFYIRRAAPSDFSPLVELQNGWCEDGCGYAPLSHSLPRLLFEHVYDTSFVAVASSSGEAVGLVVGMVSQAQLACTPTGDTQWRVSQLCHIGVSPLWRGKGVATALVGRLEGVVSGHAGIYSCSVIRCDVTLYSPHGFLRKVGFRERPCDTGGGCGPRVTMEKLLF